MLVEQMTYAEANRRIGLGEANYQIWPQDTRVWLVISQGKWSLAPMGPANSAPVEYEGCLMSVFTARDGSFILNDDAVCPIPQ